MIKSVIAVAALCGASSAFAATNLLTDGSFESVAVAAGTYADYSGSTLTGWVAGAGEVIEVRDALAGTALDGSNFVELDSTQNSSMSTTVATTVGTTYTLSFWYSNRATTAANTAFAGNVVPASSNGLSYDIGAGAVAVPTLATDTSADNLWTPYTITFVATSTSTTLSFIATGTSDSYGSSLDNVSLTTAVPEPTTLAMFGAGVLTLLGMGRRRNRGL